MTSVSPTLSPPINNNSEQPRKPLGSAQQSSPSTPTQGGPCRCLLPPHNVPALVSPDDSSSFARSNLLAYKNNLRAINGKEHLSEKPDDSEALMDTFVILSQKELMSR